MFERFTDRARRVVVLAQEEARLLNHDRIGTEHILLGLIREGEGVAASALNALGISLPCGRRSSIPAWTGAGRRMSGRRGKLLQLENGHGGPARVGHEAINDPPGEVNEPLGPFLHPTASQV